MSFPALTSVEVEDVGEAMLELFALTGVVKLRGVFSPDDAERMREVVWRDLEHSEGVHRGDPTTWRRRTPRSKLARAKRDPVFAALLGAPLRRLADALLGEGWITSSAFGNLLVDFPDASSWHLPGRDGFWHCDFGSETSMDPLPSLRVFAVFGDLEPGGGGTLLVAGSGHMLVRFFASHEDARPSLKADTAWHRDIPYLRELALADAPNEHDPDAAAARRHRFMETTSDVDGIPARVVEVCGQPGDVFVCHPWTIHCKPPNASNHPRFIRAPTLFRAPSEHA